MTGADRDHPDYDEALEEMLYDMFPASMCYWEDDCWDDKEDFMMDDESPWKFEIYCGDNDRWGGAAMKSMTLLTAAVLAYVTI